MTSSKPIPSASRSLVDINSNPHIKAKTVLTVGDGIYGARINNYNEVPSPWPTFGNKSPNSLFFSTDPVAIDCVQRDLLVYEADVSRGYAIPERYLRMMDAVAERHKVTLRPLVRGMVGQRRIEHPPDLGPPLKPAGHFQGRGLLLAQPRSQGTQPPQGQEALFRSGDLP